MPYQRWRTQKTNLGKGKGDDAKPDMGQFALEAPAAGHSESPTKSWLGTKRELGANSSV